VVDVGVVAVVVVVVVAAVDAVVADCVQMTNCYYHRLHWYDS